MTNNIYNKMNNESTHKEEDQSSQLYSIIEQPLNNDKKTLLKINEFNETINLPKVRYLSGLSIDELKHLFWEQDELDEAGEKYDMKTYLKNLHQWLIDVVKASRSEGLQDVEFFTMKKSYRRIGNKRMFVNGFGLQSCQNKIRRFLSGDSSYDIDMSKCHWNILVKKCSEYDLSCPRILKFLNNPDKYLAENNVTKHDLLILLYVDNYTSKNEELNYLHYEKHYIFKKLMETPEVKKLNFTPKEKTINPVSSVMAQVCQHLECEILIPILTKHQNVIEVLMFDGVQVNISVDVVTFIEDLNQLTEYSWIQKDNTYVIEGWESEEFADYITWVKNFEDKHFIIENPLQYCKIEYNEIITYKKTEFKDLNEPVLEKLNEWLKDENRKSYKRFNMNPYQKGTVDPSSDDEFNLWKGFKGELVDINENYFPTQFYDLLYNSLCWHDNEETRKEYTDWTIKYIAFLLQRPEILPQVGLVFESDPGSGKDLFGKILEALMGKHTITITDNPNSVFNGMKGGDNFNKDAEGKKLIILNESVTSEMKELMDKIKHYVTSDELIVNKKNKDTYTVRDVGALFIFTNNKFPLQQHDRRFVTHSAKSWTNQTEAQKEAFFKPKWDLLHDNDEINKLFTWLNNYPVHDWKPYSNRLVTSATQDSKNFAIPDYVWYLKELCDDNFDRFSVYNDDSNLRCVCSMKDFWNDYKGWIKDYKNSNYAKSIINKMVKTNLDNVNGIIFDRFYYNATRARGVIFNIKEINDWINSKYKF